MMLDLNGSWPRGFVYSHPPSVPGRRWTDTSTTMPRSTSRATARTSSPCWRPAARPRDRRHPWPFRGGQGRGRTAGLPILGFSRRPSTNSLESSIPALLTSTDSRDDEKGTLPVARWLRGSGPPTWATDCPSASAVSPFWPTITLGTKATNRGNVAADPGVGW